MQPAGQNLWRDELYESPSAAQILEDWVLVELVPPGGEPAKEAVRGQARMRPSCIGASLHCRPDFVPPGQSRAV